MHKSGFWKFSVLLLVAIAAVAWPIVVVAADPRADTSVQPQMPDVIELKTPTQTFTHKFFFMLLNGRIWVKSRTETGENGAWHPLNNSGLPGPAADKKPFSGVSYIQSISADGDNLIAVDRQNIVYYTKTYNWKWKDHFSALPFTKQLSVPAGSRALAISHRGSSMKFYCDIDGNPHKMGAGVTTLYLLADNGHMIYYADPWLPPKFAHIVDTPKKGSFIAVSMSVSGSTLFLMNAAGEMFTRLYDYDSSGQNPVLPYSYKREKRQETTRESTRSLPPEPWRLQPMIPGQFTDLITILQTGEGNAAFALRVEGVDDQGHTGYYEKPIYATEWSFVKTGLPLQRPVLVPDQENAYAPAKVKAFTGKISRGKIGIAAELLDFWPFSPPATLRFSVAGRSFDAALHMRRYGYRKNNRIVCEATIELPAEFLEQKDPECQETLKTLFAGTPLVDMLLVIDPAKVNGAEDLHQTGISELADNIISMIGKNGLTGELKAKFHKRLKLQFTRQAN